MGETESKIKKNPSGWKLLWVFPIVFSVVSLAGFAAGILEVLEQGYFGFGLMQNVVGTMAQRMNIALLIGLRLLVPMLILLGGFFFYFRDYRPAIRATLGVGLLWVGLVTGVYFLIQNQVAGIDLHRLPDFIRKSLSVQGFFERYLIGKLEAIKILTLPIKEPGVFLAAITVAVPFGLFFERMTRLSKKNSQQKTTGGKWVRVLYWLTFTFCLVAAFTLNGMAWALASKGGLPQPNVILISIDTLRADALGAYGKENAGTLALDQLAKTGAVFENTYSHSPWTLPGHASMLTGLTPTHLGIHKVQDRLDKSVLTLPEVLRNAGYKTAALTSYILVSPAYGFDQGFDQFHYNKEFDATRISQMASEFVKQNKDRKFFLFLHIYDPHWPYKPAYNMARKFYEGEPTPEIRELHTTENYYDWVVKAIQGPQELADFSRAMYQAEVSQVDAALEGFFDTLADTGVANRTIVIVTADHGEEFKEHGLMGHGLTLYDEALRVPLIVRFPALISGDTRVSMPVQLSDLFPTVLAMVNTPNPVPYSEGRDIGTDLFLREGDLSRPFLAETAMSGEVRHAYAKEGYKYITPYELHFGDEITIAHQPELYNLLMDPGETENLAGEKPTLTESMKEQLAEMLGAVDLMRNSQGRAGKEQSKALSAEEIERLRSLGYIQ